VKCSQTPTRSPGCNPYNANHANLQWINTACFVAAPAGELGNDARVPVVGPDFVNTDFSVIKQFALPRKDMGFKLPRRILQPLQSRTVRHASERHRFLAFMRPMQRLHALLQPDGDQQAKHNGAHVEEVLSPRMNDLMRRMNVDHGRSLAPRIAARKNGLIVCALRNLCTSLRPAHLLNKI